MTRVMLPPRFDLLGRRAAFFMQSVSPSRLRGTAPPAALPSSCPGIRDHRDTCRLDPARIPAGIPVAKRDRGSPSRPRFRKAYAFGHNLSGTR